VIGYAVQANPTLASYRLRVDIPRRHMDKPSLLGATGAPTFFYKNGNPHLARSVRANGIVYDVVNDHFSGTNAPDYYAMCDVADVIVCASDAMADRIHRYTGRHAAVIDDPYENEESEPACVGREVLWFGHAANLRSLAPYAGQIDDLTVCSNAGGNVTWTPENEAICLHNCAAVLLTGNNAGASSNRVAKALRAGRFVIAPEPCESWQQFKPYIWIGDVREGLAWAFNNREEVCNKIAQGQKYTRERFNPTRIAAHWTEVFDSISGVGAKSKMDG
jgi:hypothetical protein